MLRFYKLKILLTWKEVIEQWIKVVSLKCWGFIKLELCIHQKLLIHQYLLTSKVEVVQSSGSTSLSLRRGLFLASPLPEVGKGWRALGQRRDRWAGPAAREDSVPSQRVFRAPGGQLPGKGIWRTVNTHHVHQWSEFSLRTRHLHCRGFGRGEP